MKKWFISILLIFALGVSGAVFAQDNDNDDVVGSEEVFGMDGDATWRDEADIVLEVPQLEVEEIIIEADEIKATVSVKANVATLVNLSVGADVEIRNLTIEVRGVRARALLIVRLEQVYNILDRALTTLETVPEILEQLGETGTDLLDETGDTLEDLDDLDIVEAVADVDTEELSEEIGDLDAVDDIGDIDGIEDLADIEDDLDAIDEDDIDALEDELDDEDDLDLEDED